MKGGVKKKPLIERLTEHAVITESNCIEWDGPVNKKTGYTKFCLIDETGRRLYTSAHRVSAHVFLGLDLSDKKRQPNHTCDNRRCINPVHLKLGSQRDNIQDCKAKGRRANVRGSRNPQAKLSSEEVIAIRLEIAGAKRGVRSAVARRFGVSCATIHHIETGKRWSI